MEDSAEKGDRIGNRGEGGRGRRHGLRKETVSVLMEHKMTQRVL